MQNNQPITKTEPDQTWCRSKIVACGAVCKLCSVLRNAADARNQNANSPIISGTSNTM